MTKTQSNRNSSSQITEPIDQQNLLGTLARLFWTLIGNPAVLFLAVGIFQRHAPFFEVSRLDLIYWILVALLVVVRYCDIKYLGGLTAEGKPASMRDWRIYAALILSISAGIWLIARTVAILIK